MAARLKKLISIKTKEYYIWLLNAKAATSPWWHGCDHLWPLGWSAFVWLLLAFLSETTLLLAFFLTN